MSITLQISVDPKEEDALLRLYRASIRALDDVAAGVQQYQDDEFRAELRNESVLKLIGRDDDGRAQALSLVATDLSTVPWVNPRYFEVRFPEHYRRKAIFYVSVIVVQPDRQGMGFAHDLMKELTRICAQRDAVCAFDCCAANRDVIPELAYQVSVQHATIDRHEIDSQHFYAYVTSELRSETYEPDTLEIDLRTRAERGAGVEVDLAAAERPEREIGSLPTIDPGAKT
jgi:GNAT superfamily N-acetyltransferase